MQNSDSLSSKSNKQRGESVLDSDEMKPEYDFSKGERGKFYHVDAAFNFPVYLEPDVNDFLTKLAARKNVDLQDLVNEWLRVSIRLVQTAQ